MLFACFCSTYTSQWVFGTVSCKLLSVLKGVNGYASIFTMVLMSVDRYWAVVHPLKSIKYRTVRNATVVCLLLWIVCAVIMTPNWLYADVISCGKSRKCEITWPQESARAHLLFWANFELVIGFVLPVVIVGVCYTLLLVGLAQHRQSTSAASCSSSPERSRSFQRSRSSRSSTTAKNASSRPMRKVTAMVFTVTIAFVVCWTPYYVVTYNSTLIAAANTGGNLTMTNINNNHSCSDGPRRRSDAMQLSPRIFAYIVLNVVAQGLVFISSCCNPFIYCISSRKFRKYTRTPKNFNTSSQ